MNIYHSMEAFSFYWSTLNRAWINYLPSAIFGYFVISSAEGSSIGVETPSGDDK